MQTFLMLKKKTVSKKELHVCPQNVSSEKNIAKIIWENFLSNVYASYFVTYLMNHDIFVIFENMRIEEEVTHK